MPEKKILFVIPFLSGGGAERVVSIWANELAKLSDEIYLLVFYRVDHEYALDPSVSLHSIRKNKSEYDTLSIRNKLLSIRQILKEIKPDIVIPFISHVGIMLSMARIALPVKLVETIRIDPRYGPRNRLFRWMRNLSVFFSNRCIVQTKEQLLYFPRWMRGRMTVLANPIATEFSENEKVFANRQIKNIIAVGRLEKQKNHAMLISAFSKITDRHKDALLGIYGEGSQQAQLEGNIEQRCLKGKIVLHGRTNDPAGVLLNSDLYVLTSDSEGMPNSLMEAMASGLPCISTNCPTGPADLIENGINGLLIQTGDTKALASAIEWMISNPEEAIEMGRKARETVLGRYSAPANAKALMGFLESV